MTTSLDRKVEARLADHEVRYTNGRRRVVQALALADGPKSAAELSGVIGPKVPLSSLYRTLAVLEEARVIAPHYSVKGLARYELAEWLAGHHHHLVCVDCGAVEDITIPERLEGRVEAVVSEIGTIASFRATNHALEVEGLCVNCA